jgi:hypothetical protein
VCRFMQVEATFLRFMPFRFFARTNYFGRLVANLLFPVVRGYDKVSQLTVAENVEADPAREWPYSRRTLHYILYTL